MDGADDRVVGRDQIPADRRQEVRLAVAEHVDQLLAVARGEDENQVLEGDGVVFRGQLPFRRVFLGQ